MSTPTFLADPALFSGAAIGSTIALDASTAHHIRVTRIKESETIHVVDGRGTRYSGQVSPDGIFQVLGIVQEPAPRLQITVAQALIKGDRLERAVEMMTEVGAMSFVPWQADHSVVSWNKEKSERNHQKWTNVVRAATEQSRRSFVPSVEPLVVGARLASISDHFDQVVLLEERDPVGRAKGATLTSGTMLMVIGPEGGISDAERDAFRNATNVHSLTLGNTVLRSATAGVVGLTYLFTTAGEWNGHPPGVVKG